MCGCAKSLVLAVRCLGVEGWFFHGINFQNPGLIQVKMNTTRSMGICSTKQNISEGYLKSVAWPAFSVQHRRRAKAGGHGKLAVQGEAVGSPEWHLASLSLLVPMSHDSLCCSPKQPLTDQVTTSPSRWRVVSYQVPAPSCYHVIRL